MLQLHLHGHTPILAVTRLSPILRLFRARLAPRLSFTNPLILIITHRPAPDTAGWPDRVYGPKHASTHQSRSRLQRRRHAHRPVRDGRDATGAQTGSAVEQPGVLVAVVDVERCHLPRQ